MEHEARSEGEPRLVLVAPSLGLGARFLTPGPSPCGERGALQVAAAPHVGRPTLSIAGAFGCVRCSAGSSGDQEIGRWKDVNRS